MKIEEAVKLYELISNISWNGLIGIMLLIIVVIIGTYALFIKEKGSKKLNILHSTLGLTSIFLISISLYILKKDADNRKELLMKANYVKSTFISYGFKLMGYERIRLFSDNPQEFPNEVLNELTASYSSEFIKVKIADCSDPIGIKLIDPVSLDKIDAYNLSHLPFIKETIYDFMKRNHIDSLSYQDVRDRIDVYFDDEWIELMLSKYDSIFTPYSIPDKNAPYSNNHKFKLKKHFRTFYELP